MSDAADRIPQELIDDIIDSIPSKRDLSSCTLVSRSWLTRSRRNLFAEVNLKDKGVQNHFHSFLAFLTASNKDYLLGPPISGCIQRVCIQNCRPLSRPRERIKMDMLRSLLSLLPNLRDLELSKATFSGVTPVDPEDWLAFRSIHLDSLSLLGVTTVSETPSEIIASLCLFSSINVLRIETLNMKGFAGLYNNFLDSTAQPIHPLLSMENPYFPSALLSTENPYFPSALRVSSIKFPDSSRTPFFLALIANTASVATITDVDVACSSSVQIRALGSFLSVVGSRIKKIAVDIIKLASEFPASAFIALLDLSCCDLQYNIIALTSSYILQAFNLSACITLTQLTLRVDLLPHRENMNFIAFKAASTFLSVTSTTVQTVILEIWIGDTATQSWRDMDVLHYLNCIRESATSAFMHFQSVIKQREGVQKLCVRWGDLSQRELNNTLIERMDSFGRSQLSELDAKGILCFERI